MRIELTKLAEENLEKFGDGSADSTLFIVRILGRILYNLSIYTNKMKCLEPQMYILSLGKRVMRPQITIRKFVLISMYLWY